MDDGIIELDTDRGNLFGFTSDKFSGYLWKTGRYIYVSAIISRQEGEGNFSQLVKAIRAQGYGVKVPAPFAKMVSIVKHLGFTPTIEPTEEKLGDIEFSEPMPVWVLG